MSRELVASAADTGFLFGGRLSLDLTWTVRFRAVHPTDLLSTPEALGEWLHAEGLPTPTTPTTRDLAGVRRLRDAIDRAVDATLSGLPIGDADREELNRWAARPTHHPVLDPHGVRHAAHRGREVEAAGSAIARDAIDLLAGAADSRLRRCEGPLCSLVFHDNSRPGTRRWCTTARCGNRVNTKAYRSRRRESTASDGGDGASTD